MTTDSTAAANPVMLQSEVIGKVVIKPDTAEEVGRVSRLWLDPKAHQIVGLECTAGALGIKRHAYNWLQIASIGSEGVILKAHIGPEATKPDTVVFVLGDEVWTDGGSRAGLVVDYRLDPTSGHVLDYLFTTDGWGGLTSGLYRLHPAGVIGVSDRRLVCTVSSVEAAELESPGVVQKVQQAREFLKKDYSQTKADVSNLKQKLTGLVGQVQSSAQSLTEQTKATLADKAEQLQQTTEKAKETLSDKAGQLQQTAENAAAQAKERLADATTQVQATGEKAKESMANLTAQAQDKAQQLSEQAQGAIAEATQRRQPTEPPAASPEELPDSADL
ncbi:PRC-barrel domain-containing protein [Thermoleptolyngbya sp. C42_A2020_037]|uniref:PRC-barrel domain-containing protein n=1 Tax=Thermoleptolyngbya sp. C42_A2020_037 TaxID=2747799 RepID=UPI0019DA9B7A|nr:PRC-barrel domain-containing protein [Thermoleptolyngbya sp. C42_A2020_037]MBF2083735.1 PRC-barrel domain-containing protein [Thermoleptolyngbya sp. C42_A2020_037]